MNKFNLSIIKFNLSEHFNVVRWCIAIITLAFVAVVSVAKYIQLSDMTAITFSSLEITYLILSDAVNITYIYMPLYLLLISGLMFDSYFGSLELLKSRSRSGWLMGKYVTLVIYTLVYCILVIAINYTISSKVFYYSGKWSSDFINTQVFLGQNPVHFSVSPQVLIGTFMVGVCLLYLLIGTLYVVLAIKLEKESYVLLITLALGLFIGVFMMQVVGFGAQISTSYFKIQCLLLLCGTGISLAVANNIINHKDLNTNQSL